MVKSSYLLGFFCLKNPSKKLIRKNKEVNSKKQICENNFSLYAKDFFHENLFPRKILLLRCTIPWRLTVG